jgi:hypothetical protein
MAATVTPQRMEGVWLAAPYIEGHYDPLNGIAIKDGYITKPMGAGLGVSVDETLFGDPVLSV